jgi:hypothetical protein
MGGVGLVDGARTVIGSGGRFWGVKGYVYLGGGVGEDDEDT